MISTINDLVSSSDDESDGGESDLSTVSINDIDVNEICDDSNEWSSDED